MLCLLLPPCSPGDAENGQRSTAPLAASQRASIGRREVHQQLQRRHKTKAQTTGVATVRSAPRLPHSLLLALFALLSLGVATWFLHLRHSLAQ